MIGSQRRHFHLQIKPIDSGFILILKCKELSLFGLRRLHSSLVFFSFYSSFANASCLAYAHIFHVLTELFAQRTRGFVNFHSNIELSEVLLDPDFFFEGLAFGIDTDALEIKAKIKASPSWGFL